MTSLPIAPSTSSDDEEKVSIPNSEEEVSTATSDVPDGSWEGWMTVLGA
jgi:hypothetical protein